MLGGRLGASSALSPPLRYGRKHLVPSPTTALQRITTPRCQQKRSLSMPHKSSTSRRPSPSGNVIQRSGAATAIRSQSSAAGGSGRAGGEGVGKRAQLVVAGVVSVAAATLARERQFPESFAEWDDQLVWQEVHELAQLSNMTNKDPPLIAKWFDCHGYTGGLVVRDLPEVSTRYFVHVGHLPGEKTRVHHVAIRGTVSLSDLSIDLKTRQVFDEECGCLFHAGFKEVAEAVAEDITPLLESGVEVKLTGHSLGGAVAVIVAAKLKLRGYNVGKVTTFGAPMITDARGAAHLRELINVMRVTHERDPVPLTPLTRTKLFSAEGRSHEGSAAGDAVVSSTGGAEGVFGSMAEGAGEVRATSSDGVPGEGGRRPRDAPRWRTGSSSAYSHFGSQVVLLRRTKCLECRREEASASSPPLARLQRRRTRIVGSWDDIWGPPPGSSVAAAGLCADDDKCQHCPSRGTTYYDPKGEGCFFDSAWLRLSNINFTHRMNRYEVEVADRLGHHLLRDHAGDTQRVSPARDHVRGEEEGRVAVSAHGCG